MHLLNISLVFLNKNVLFICIGISTMYMLRAFSFFKTTLLKLKVRN